MSQLEKSKLVLNNLQQKKPKSYPARVVRMEYPRQADNIAGIVMYLIDQGKHYYDEDVRRLLKGMNLEQLVDKEKLSKTNMTPEEIKNMSQIQNMSSDEIDELLLEEYKKSPFGKANNIVTEIMSAPANSGNYVVETLKTVGNAAVGAFACCVNSAAKAAQKCTNVVCDSVFSTLPQDQQDQIKMFLYRREQNSLNTAKQKEDNKISDSYPEFNVSVQQTNGSSNTKKIKAYMPLKDVLGDLGTPMNEREDIGVFNDSSGHRVQVTVLNNDKPIGQLLLGEVFFKANPTIQIPNQIFSIHLKQAGGVKKRSTTRRQRNIKKKRTSTRNKSR